MAKQALKEIRDAENTGFVNPSVAVLSFSDSTPDRTLTVTVSGSALEFYIQNVKYSIAVGTDTVQISNIMGLWYIYYNGDTLTASHTMPDRYEYLLVATVYWNSNDSAHYNLCPELHKIITDYQTDQYRGRVKGLEYEGGLDIEGSGIGGDGSNNSDAQISFNNSAPYMWEAGWLYNEDVRNIILAKSSPANPWEQDLNSPSDLPVWYKLGTRINDFEWKKRTATTYPFYESYDCSNEAAYNKNNGGSWELDGVTDGNYFVSWIVADNNQEDPIAVIMGEGDYASMEAARLAKFEDMELGWDWGDDPMYEESHTIKLKMLYKLIFKFDSSYTNTPEVVIQEIIDYRRNNGGHPKFNIDIDHRSLANLDAEGAHPSEAISPLFYYQMPVCQWTNSFDGAISAVNPQQGGGSVDVPVTKIQAFADSQETTAGILFVFPQIGRKPKSVKVRGYVSAGTVQLKTYVFDSSGTGCGEKTTSSTTMATMTLVDADGLGNGTYTEGEFMLVYTKVEGTFDTDDIAYIGDCIVEY